MSWVNLEYVGGYEIMCSFIQGVIDMIDRTGERFGKLVVLGLHGKKGNDRTVWVRCDCGAEKELIQSRLTQKTKPARSCGCGVLENHLSTHNMTHHKWYSIWKAMIGRCYRTNNRGHDRYGARGIGVCDEWRKDPRPFIKWLGENGYGPGLQIDRIDNNGDYSPENCRAATRSENCNNRRDNVFYEYGGENLTCAEISRRTGMKYATVRKRLKNGVPLDLPVRYRLCHM